MGSHPVNVSYTSATAKAKIANGSLLAAPVVNATNPTGQVKLVKGYLVVCSTCHGVHNTDSRSSTFDPFSSNHTFGQLSSSRGYLLRVDAFGKTADDVNICTNCHAGKKNHNLNFKDGKKPVQCNDCHSGHVEYDAAAAGGSEEARPNIYLVRRYLQYTTAGRMSKRVFYRYTSAAKKEYYNAAGKGVCQSCHLPPSSGPTNHYNGNGTFPETGHPNCGGCHVHTTAKGAFSPTCNACHGNPPTSTDNMVYNPNPTGALGVSSFNAHSTHVKTKKMSCEVCHNLYTVTGMGSIAGSIEMGFAVNNTNWPKFTGSTAVTFGSFSGNQSLLNGFSYAPGAGQTGTSVETGNGTRNSCNVYCHGAWPNSGRKINPSWIGSTQAACGNCHAATLATPPTSGGHTKHVATYQFSCTTCHPARIDHDEHVNGSVQWQFDTASVGANATYSRAGATGTGTSTGGTNALASNGSYGSCASIYCHSDGFNFASPNYNVSRVWGGSIPACDSCHGNKSPLAPISSGSHAKHIARFECADCHNTTVTSGSGSISSLTTHVNRLVDLKFAAGNINGTATYGGVDLPLGKTSSGAPGFASCANVRCHNDGTDVWTGTLALKTSPVWGATDFCGKCHGNATYSDYRKAAPLYASDSPKPNAHVYHVDTRTVPSGEIQCRNCHSSVTTSNSAIDGSQTSDHYNGGYNILGGGTFRDGDNPGDITAVTVTTTTGSSPTVNSCSNVSCHSIGLDTATGAPKTRASSAVTWDNKFKCIDCHSMNMQGTDTFHHAMRNYSSSYPTAAPDGSATNGTNPQNRRCTMCHVNHDIFSPNLNTSSGGRGYSLRSDINVAPTKTTGFANSDFIKNGTGGICISCHFQARTKDTTRRRIDPGVTTTPVITYLNFSGSAHQFSVPGTMLSDGSTFQGNCSKCHNATTNEISVFMNITTAAGSTGLSFGNHNGTVRRLQGSLGAAGGETAEEQICYRCHHDGELDAGTSPGGGPTKTLVNYDFYGVKPMDNGSEGIFAIMMQNGSRVIDPSFSYTEKLYFKAGSTQSDYDGTVYPADPMPAAPGNDGEQGDTFAGGTYVIRSMSPWARTNDASYTSDIKSQTSSQTGLRYWKMVKFVSPPAAVASGDLAGTWAINVYSRESSTSLNARIRYMVYKWSGSGAGSKGATIVAKGTYATELATTRAPGANRQVAINVAPGTSLAVGEKIVVDLALETNEATNGSRTGYFYFGRNAPSNLTLPAAVTWSYGDPGSNGFGHNVNGYKGLHKPSPVDETRAYISENKHVECVDCHNPHALKSGLHTPGSPAMATALRGATGVGVTTWGANWVAVAPASYNPGSTTDPLITATAEWQVCFKCHSGANAKFANWSSHDHTSKAPTGAAAWTDLSLEFNPNNKSGHPVVTGLNSYPNSVAPKAVPVARMKAPWTNVGTQVMTCSDCHITDSTQSKGPHGSSVKWMLSGTNKAWPYTTAAANGTGSGTYRTLSTYNTNNGTVNGLFCLNCHTIRPVSGGNGFHTNSNLTGGQHGGSSGPPVCVSCHIRVPHGGKISRLLMTTNAPARYRSNGTSTNPLFTGWGRSGVNIKGQSTSGNFDTSCGEHNSSGGEVW